MVRQQFVQQDPQQELVSARILRGVITSRGPRQAGDVVALPRWEFDTLRGGRDFEPAAQLETDAPPADLHLREHVPGSTRIRFLKFYKLGPHATGPVHAPGDEVEVPGLDAKLLVAEGSAELV